MESESTLTEEVTADFPGSDDQDESQLLPQLARR